MKNNKEDPFKNAEALRQIQSMPELELPEIKAEEKSDVIDNIDDFRSIIGAKQMEELEKGDPTPHVEVSEKLYKYLLKNHKSRYLTYGNPGVKVYLAGTKDTCDGEDSLNAEDYHQYITRKRISERGIKF